MAYRKMADSYLLSLRRGDDLMQALTELARAEHLSAGTISGLGACDQARLAVFDPVTRHYEERELSGTFEICSLIGSISVKEGEPYLHVHIALADENLQMWGGHLKAARISAVAEVFIRALPARLERRWDERLGLNVFDLEASTDA